MWSYTTALLKKGEKTEYNECVHLQTKNVEKNEIWNLVGYLHLEKKIENVFTKTKKFWWITYALLSHLKIKNEKMGTTVILGEIFKIITCIQKKKKIGKYLKSFVGKMIGIYCVPFQPLFRPIIEKKNIWGNLKGFNVLFKK